MDKRLEVVGVHPAELDKKPPAKKPKRLSSKDQVRLKFLRQIPKGGMAIEIGVWQGEFSATILEELRVDHLCLIDPWIHIEDDSHSNAFVGRTGAEKMEKIFRGVKTRYQREIDAGKMSIIRDFSVTALSSFKDKSIDFAYVDGDHSYDGVKADLRALYPKLKPGGVMAFDDYHRRGWWGIGVIKAINEFLGQHPNDLRIRAVVGAQIGIQKLAD
ncbi:MAG: class I SAM-dependent methyltransferase [Pseudomonadota bacterium]